MPQDFVYETAITVDHEAGTCRVDTTVRGVAAELVRRGFREVGDQRSLPYRRFVGQADQLRFRKPKGQRKVVGVAATKAAARRASMVSQTGELAPQDPRGIPG